MQSALELVVGESFDLAAVVADEVVMVLAVRVEGLEAGRARPDVDALNEPILAQLLEHAVDARDPDATPLGPQLIEDLLRGQAAVLASKKLDDGAAGAAVSVARRRQ